MRTHVQTLGTKAYRSQFEEAPDYVVMFVPGEHFVAAALEQDPELWDFAFRNKVLLATPTNLVAIARTVAQVWRQDNLAARGAGDRHAWVRSFYDRLAVAAEHLKRHRRRAEQRGKQVQQVCRQLRAQRALAQAAGLRDKAHRDRQARDRRGAAGRKLALCENDEEGEAATEDTSPDEAAGGAG